MAIQPLDQRLDLLNEVIANDIQREELTSTAVDASAEFPDAQPAEPVVVAGPLSVITKAAGLARKAERPLKKPDLLSPEAAEAAKVQDIERSAQAAGLPAQQAGIAARVELRKEPGLTPEKVAAEQQQVMAEPEILTGKPSGRAKDEAGEKIKVPVTAFNLPVMDTTDSVKSFIQAIDNLDPAKPATIVMKDVVAKAKEAGIGTQFIDDLFKKRLEVNPENTYKALNAVVWAGKRLDVLAEKVASGKASSEELAEMAQTIHFSNVLQQEVKGFQTNIAQSLAIMRMPRDGIMNISTIMENMGNQTDVVRFAQAYTTLQDPAAKAALIKAGAQGNVWEKLFGVYVNGLLSRFTTHVKNFGSNTIFMLYRLAERELAAGIGSVRKLAGLGTQDAYLFSEVPAMLASTPAAFMDGLQMAAYAWKTGVPKHWSDPIKIARQQSRMELFNYKADGSLLSAATKGLNFVTTLPGRSLMTADEFFKAINYKHELTGEAVRLASKTFDDAVKGGASVADAQKLADDAVTRFVDNPPESIMQMAETGTFTQKLEGTFGELQKSLHPSSPARLIARMQMPFIATPVNIMGEVVQRTPLGMFSKNLWKDLAKGGTKESDLAIAKIGLGTSAMYTFSNWAAGGSITGSGPAEKGTRDAMIRQGWQPYSIVIDTDDINKELVNKFPGTARFGTGDYQGKIFLSYQGLEPVGALMAIGADYADFAKYEVDDSRINAYVGGAVFGIANYTMEHPFLQGISNIFQLIGAFSSGDKNKFVGGMDKFTEMIATSARKAVTPLSGAITSVKEKFDPVARDYKADPNLPAGMRGLMEALNKMRGETPGLSTTLPPKLNIWGEAQDYEYAYAPFRLKDGKAREVDSLLIQMNVNQEMPGRELTAQDPGTGLSASIKLTTEEYNDMLRIANNEYDLENRILEVAKEAEKYADKSSVVHFQNSIKFQFDLIFSAARQTLLSRNKEMQDRLADQAKRLEQYGRGAK